MTGGKPVLCMGETLIDLIASDNSTTLQGVNAFVARAGGAPANVSVALARLGVPSAFCGVIGTDPFGERLRATLTGAGVDASRLRSSEEADTTIAFAWKDERGDGHFRLLRMADRLLNDADVASAKVEEIAALVVGSVALSAEPSHIAVVNASRAAASAGVPVFFDVNMRPALWPSSQVALNACEPVFEVATVLKLSLDDGRALFPNVADADGVFRAARHFPAKCIVVTDGDRGAWFANRTDHGDDDLEFIARFNVDAIDPTGAGDAFSAALISRLIARDWESLTAQDVRFAAAAGALATTKRGAMEALPTRAEIDRFLTKA